MTNREMPALPKASEGPPSEAPAAKGEEKAAAPAPAPKNAKIEVVAIEKGFFKQQRKDKGDKFFVDKFEQLGSWMKCVDPGMQKKHAEAMKARKSLLRARASGGADNPRPADE